MKWNRMLLGAAAICFTASSLQAAVYGSFTLPSQTKWGSAVLPARDYNFTLDYATQERLIIISRGTKSAGEPKGSRLL